MSKTRNDHSSEQKIVAKNTTSKTNNTRFEKLRFEKDPTICLVYNTRGARGRYLSKSEYVALNAGGQIRENSVDVLSGSRPKICADGDSWINILYEISRYFGYQMTFFDVIESKQYYARSVAWPGSTFEQLLLDRNYHSLVGSGIYDYFIFSGGGNDLLGGGALTQFLRHRTDASGFDPEDYLRIGLVKDVLHRVEEGYMAIADDVKAKSRPHNTKMLVHGYDVPTPLKDGPWLGGPFTRRGFDLKKDKTLIHAILTYLVDALYDLLHRVEAKKANVEVVDLRGCVAGRWNDELHPKKAASIDIAARFTAKTGPNIP